MRVPIFVPLLLMVASAGLFAFDIVSVVNATREPGAYHVTHSDDNQTFVAAVLTPLEPGEELRSPHAGGWFLFSREASDGLVTVRDLSPDPSREAEPQTNGSIKVVSLHQRGEYLIIPAWQIDRLAAGENVSVLHRSLSLDGLRFVPGAMPPPESEDVHGWPGSLAVVMRLLNETEDYLALVQMMQASGGGMMPDLYAVEGAVVARDPWLRGTAVGMAAAALVLAVLPRIRSPPGLAQAPAGGSVELAAAGRTFLTSIRNAYVALVGAVVLLGIPLIVSTLLFTKNATGPAGHLEFIGTGDPWEGTVWLQMLFILFAGVVAAARPALDAQLALRRWRRAEAASPIEGDLGP